MGSANSEDRFSNTNALRHIVALSDATLSASRFPLPAFRVPHPHLPSRLSLILRPKLPQHVHNHPVAAPFRELQIVDPVGSIDSHRRGVLVDVQNADVVVSIGGWCVLASS